MTVIQRAEFFFFPDHLWLSLSIHHSHLAALQIFFPFFSGTTLVTHKLPRVFYHVYCVNLPININYFRLVLQDSSTSSNLYF